jgi:hypothetical protein
VKVSIDFLGVKCGDGGGDQMAGATEDRSPNTLYCFVAAKFVGEKINKLLEPEHD